MTRELLDELVRHLEATDKWAGDLVLSNEAWGGGMAANPTLTDDLVERWVELQDRRNDMLAKLKAVNP